MGVCANEGPPRRRAAAATTPAVTATLAAPGGQLLFHAAVLGAAWAHQQVLAIQLPKLPKVSLPKVSLPKISLPGGLGKGAGDAETKAPPPPRRGALGDIKVRPASSARAGEAAPTLAEVTGQQEGAASIGSAAGWKRFPNRRMPGANMDPWKDIARDITPKL